MAEISEAIARLRQISVTPVTVAEDEEVINVSSATRRIAFAYERFRNTLEPDEEDILRRKAISRILERRLYEDRPPLVTATAILQELIRAHYIKAVPVRYATLVADIIKKVAFIDARLEGLPKEWFIRLAAVALDRLFYPRHQEEALVYAMYEDVVQRAVWTDNLIEEKDRTTQLYVACHRSLFAIDDFELAYHYFIHQFPAWEQPTFTEAEASRVANRLPDFYQQMQTALGHPGRERLTRLLRPAAVPYRIIRDILNEKPEALETDEAALAEVVRQQVQARMQRIRQKMNRRVWHSVLFLFLTKTFIGVLVELPYELIFLQGVHWLALGMNIAFHPVFLFFLALSARLPGQRNTDKIVEQVQRIVTKSELPTIIISAVHSYGTLTWSLFALTYGVLFMGIFWTMFTVLETLNFSLVAMGMFVIFLGLVSFLAIRIRGSVDAIRVVPKREGALSTLISFLSLPILEFGRFLAQNISQINVALFFMDSVLEAPFKLLIDITEEWFVFVRDRREEIT